MKKNYIRQKPKNIKVWSKIACGYSKLVVPNRPSDHDCANYAHYIYKILKDVNNPKIMLMGSTPELRSILYTYTFKKKAQIFTVDLSADMHQAMREFVVPATKPELKEEFFCGSWLKTNFPDNFFDLVVGDEVICNVCADQHQNLFAEINRILKNGGHWVTRHNFYLAENVKQSPKSIILNIVDNINDGKYTFQYSINILYLLLFYRLVIDQAQHCVNVSDEIKVIKKILPNISNIKQRQTLKELLRVFEKYFGSYKNYYWYVLSKQESLKELKDYFQFKGELYAKDYLTVRHSPIWLLKKK
ncbi:MAG: class I SAM-dependent methyltransferase [Patescibacteria group bacterium]|nr:class I SAM-dependent methyltransferase [Patescibacteria group bacterium]MDD5121020.1 class I SAM-dependent methyltransferase [Patescibacteria group bacterium]MDD5221619.1 class I SAM-dependent methyltransferase [Patescibacteria group bacterium]MDD5396061.1 class I SAM-dependent methyltransferase [Patescibacteria group bacterium]